MTKRRNKRHWDKILINFVSSEVIKNYKGIEGATHETILYKEGISVETKLDGYYHSFDDEPSVAHFYFDTKSSFKAWYVKSVLHRDKGPAWVKGHIEHFYYYGKKQKNEQFCFSFN